MKGMRAHSATVVGSDVWCFGGCDIRGNCFKDVWKFDVGELSCYILVFFRRLGAWEGEAS